MEASCEEKVHPGPRVTPDTSGERRTTVQAEHPGWSQAGSAADMGSAHTVSHVTHVISPFLLANASAPRKDHTGTRGVCGQRCLGCRGKVLAAHELSHQAGHIVCGDPADDSNRMGGVVTSPRSQNYTPLRLTLSTKKSKFAKERNVNTRLPPELWFVIYTWDPRAQKHPHSTVLRLPSPAPTPSVCILSSGRDHTSQRPPGAVTWSS